MDRWAVIGGLANCSWSVLEEVGSSWRLVEHNAGSLPEPVMSDEE
jgi:probable phosphoglycerate mutase